MSISIPFQRVKKRIIDNCYEDWFNTFIPVEFLHALKETRNYQQLCTLLKEYFLICIRNKILDGKTIDFAKNEFEQYGIYHNIAIDNGYVLISKSQEDQETEDSYLEMVGNVTVVSIGYSKVSLSDRARGYALGNSLIKMYEDATLSAYDNVSVFAYGDTTVYAFDNASVRADSNSFVISHDNSSIKAMCHAKVQAKDNSKVVLMGLASAIIENNSVIVEAKGKSYLSSEGKINCRLSQKAIYHDLESNTLYYADENMKFEFNKKIEVEF